MKVIGVVYYKPRRRLRLPRWLNRLLRREWSPFDETGYLDEERLKAEGWQHIGALREDDA